MARKRTGLATEQLKKEAIIYFREHTELTAKECAAKYGVSAGTLYKWNIDFQTESTVSENSCSNIIPRMEENEVARLKRELQDAKNEIEVLKNVISILGKNN